VVQGKEEKGNEVAEALSFEATGSSAFEPGPYRGRLVDITRKFKQREKPVFDPEVGEKVMKKVDDPYLVWTWEILEEGYEHKTLTSLSGASFGYKLNGEPAKARGYANALRNKPLENGEKFTSDDLIGNEATLHIDNEKTERGTFARVVEVTPAADGAPF
jgi:hypothetical protein